MFSLQRLLGKEDKFFDLLEAGAREARTSVEALVKLTKTPDQAGLLYDFINSRRKEKQIRAEITEAVYTTFVTALEREDIDNLSHAIYRIPKTVEKFVERLSLAPQQVKGIDFSKQIDLLEPATSTILDMVKSLRRGANLEQIKALNDKLQDLEGEADKTIMALYKDLYNGAHEPIKAMMLKDLYELLEKIIDRCRDVGNVVSHIVLKNSWTRMTLILTVILVALVFEYINGFHDTANSIATVVSTKVLTPRQAVILAAVTNLFGALWGMAVAKTITSGLVDAKIVSMTSGITICVLLGAITWNLITWWFGLPSSSSHALIGGLCGAALAASHNNWHAIIWSQPNHEHWYKGAGLLWKVIVPMFLSPLLGFVIGFVIMAALYFSFRNRRPTRVNKFFGVAQMFSAGGMGIMHGTNDAQKTMGIIALVLVAATKAGHLENLPDWLSFLRIPESKDIIIPLWIKVLCAITMAAGTAVGGWRIIRTLGHKMVKLHPINGFAAEASSTLVIFTATMLGIPVSTTHNISASIMGVGSAKRFNAIKWVVVERMAWAWVFTLPVAGAIAYGLVRLAQLAGWVP